MAFTVNGSDVMSNFDTTYANENIVNVTGFKVNGTDIGNTATPGVSGYTSDNAVEDDAFKTANVSFNQLFSTSKPLVVVHSLGSTTNRTIGDYKFRENVGNTGWRSLFRFTIPNIKGIQIPLRILLIGGGGGGGSSAKPGHWEGAGGGGAGTFLELTMTLDERHDQAYFYGICGSGGGGGGNADSEPTYGTQGQYGGNTVLQLRNTNGYAINQYLAEGGAGGGGNRTTAGSYPKRDGNSYGSCGGCCGVGGTKNPVAAGSIPYSASISISDEHPTTTVDAVRVNSGGGARHIQGGGGGGGAGGAGGTGGTIGGFFIENGRVIDRSEGFGGANGGAGYSWITGSTYAGGGGGDNRTSQSMQYGNHSYDRYGNPGQGGSGGGGGNSHGQRNATNGTGSGGMGSFDWWSGVHGGNGGHGITSIGIPRIFTDANYHTFTPLYY